MKSANKTKKKTRVAPSVPTRTAHDQLAREAAEWSTGARTPAVFEDAPDAAPRASESKPVSLRLPRTLLDILRQFAEREGIGYQVLIKRWLDDRVRVERERMRSRAATASSGQARGQQQRRRFSAPSFPMVDRREGEPGHYQQRL